MTTVDETKERDLNTVYDAMFGAWDPTRPGKRMRGVLERLTAIERALLVVGVLVAVRFIGVPTEMIFPLIWKWISHAP